MVVKAEVIVTTNTLLGQVGNTSNTSEPHLHIHVDKNRHPNFLTL